MYGCNVLKNAGKAARIGQAGYLQVGRQRRCRPRHDGPDQLQGGWQRPRLLQRHVSVHQRQRIQPPRSRRRQIDVMLAPDQARGQNRLNVGTN